MKLLLYSHFFAPSIGGVENIILSLASGLAGFRSPSGEKEFDVLLVTQTPAAHFDDSALSFRVVRQPRSSQLWKLIRSADLIHLAGPALAPLLLSFIARKPVVIEHHGYQTICLNGMLLEEPSKSVCPGHFQAGHYSKCLRCNAAGSSWFRSGFSLACTFLRRWLARRASVNLAISQHVLSRHALPNSCVVYYGIDDPLTKVAHGSSPLQTAPMPCFAFVGRFVSEKGIPILLEAARILVAEGHKFELRLIGDGPERARIEEMIARHRLKACVCITGFLNGAALANALSDVAIVVMPSVCEETAGLAAIEQMIRGRLVIASDIGGLAEVIGSAGLTFPVGDASALADQMKTVLENPSLVEQFGYKARERARNLFLRERMITDHARIYHQARTGHRM